MSIAVTEDHRVLAKTVADFLAKHQARAIARGLLESDEERLPGFWTELAGLGLLGIHLPEELGGAGFTLSEVLVVAEQLGRAVAPGPFVPTVITSALIAAAAPEDLRKRLLPGLADGSLIGAAALGGDVPQADGIASGNAGVVISGALADILLVPSGDDVLVIEKALGGVTVTVPANLDPSRRAAKVRLEAARATVLPGARGLLTDIARTVFAAEAAGIAAEVTDQASDYAKTRVQFGRPIATFQAVKHHCANMLVAAELATAAAWDAGRAGVAGGDQLSYTAAIAATLAIPAAVDNAQLNIQVHGGIGFTWEHDAHLYLRRAAAVAAVVDAEQAARDVTDLVRRGVRRAAAIDLPAEAEPIRAALQAEVARLRELDGDARKQALIETGYVMPHWPRPWGRDAAAIEQLVIEQEFAAAGIKRPAYGITGWVILTLIQHASQDQVARWVRPALNQDLIWCQLFSEPGAGSDAAGIRTKATKVGRRLADQRPEGLDERRPPGQLRPGHRPHQPRRAQAPGHHHDGDRHARARRHGQAAADAHRALGLQRGVLRRRVRARRRRGRADRRRLDGRAGDAGQRERQHRRGRRRHGHAAGDVHRATRCPSRTDLGWRWPGRAAPRADRDDEGT